MVSFLLSSPRSTSTNIAVAANGFVTLAIRNGGSSLLARCVSRFAYPSVNAYSPLPGTETRTATLGKLFFFTSSWMSASSLRATSGENKSVRGAGDAPSTKATAQKRRAEQKRVQWCQLGGI